MGYKSYILCSESSVINYLLTEVDPGVHLFFHGGDFVIRVISRKFSGPRAILELVTDRACLSRTWKILSFLFRLCCAQLVLLVARANVNLLLN